MSSEYFKAITNAGEYMNFFSVKFGEIGNVNVGNNEELEGVVKSFRFELEKTKTVFSALKSIEPPKGSEKSNEQLMGALDKYLFFTEDAVDKLSIKDAEGMLNALTKQNSVAKEIMEICRTFQ